MKKENPKIRYLGMLSVIVIFIGIIIAILILAKRPTLSYQDLEISNFEWETCTNPPCAEPPIYYSEGQLVGEGNLVLTSKKEIYAKIWVNDEISDITSDSPLSVEGERRIHLRYIPLSSLYETIKIEVCFSPKSEFNKLSKDVICKEKLFTLPKFSVDVFPDTLEFTVSKSSRYVEERKNITIVNTGEIPIEIAVFLPRGTGYPYPEYVTYGFVEGPKHIKDCESMNLLRGGIQITLLGGCVYSALFPGESAKYDIGVVAGDFDMPVGVYTSKAFIGAFYPSRHPEDALYRKEFNIILRVVE